MTNSQKFEAIFKKAGINIRRVSALGSFVHVDTFKKYEGDMLHMMDSAGFSILSISDGAHLDGIDGYRMVFKAR